MRRFLSASLLALLMAMTMLGAPSRGSGPMPTPFGGVLRNEHGEGWHLLSDATHRPQGLGTVTCDKSGEISIWFSPAVLGVVYVSVDADETYVWAGYATGARASNARLQISFARSGTFVRCDSPALWIDKSNVWVGGVVLI